MFDFAFRKPKYRHFPDHEFVAHLNGARLVNNPIAFAPPLQLLCCCSAGHVREWNIYQSAFGGNRTGGLSRSANYEMVLRQRCEHGEDVSNLSEIQTRRLVIIYLLHDISGAKALFPGVRGWFYRRDHAGPADHFHPHAERAGSRPVQPAAADRAAHILFRRPGTDSGVYRRLWRDGL